MHVFAIHNFLVAHRITRWSDSLRALFWAISFLPLTLSSSPLNLVFGLVPTDGGNTPEATASLRLHPRSPDCSFIFQKNNQRNAAHTAAVVRKCSPYVHLFLAQGIDMQ